MTQGIVMLSSAKRRYTLAQLEKEQEVLKRTMGWRLIDKGWFDGTAHGRERL